MLAIYIEFVRHISLAFISILKIGGKIMHKEVERSKKF